MYLFCLDEGRSQDVLGGQWSWEKPGVDVFVSTSIWDAKYHRNNLCIRDTLACMGKKIVVSTGIWDVKYPWNNFPQNTSATLGNVLAFQTYLQRQGSSEELYIGSRAHPNKTLSPKNQTEKPFESPVGIITENTTKNWEECAINTLMEDAIHASCSVFFRCRGVSKMCWVVWEKAAVNMLFFAAWMWTNYMPKIIQPFLVPKYRW